ncbi:hypothetical protein AusDCA_1959 [Desulfitobacterium sp. AusDCA]
MVNNTRKDPLRQRGSFFVQFARNKHYKYVMLFKIYTADYG